MPEVQQHGFMFEKWIKNTFFEGYQNNYSYKWDIAKEANFNFGNLPISIKTAKWGSSINMGDAIRQYSIDEDFILIVGFWKQENNFKIFVNVTSTIITKGLWKKLWEPLKLEEIEKLDKLIKDYKVDCFTVRDSAKNLKKSKPYCESLITLNPKIDSKSQRRLQCSIKFDLFFDKISKKELKKIIENSLLWGIEVPKTWESSRRTFNR